MKRNKLWIVTVSLVLMMALCASAQKKPQRPTKKPAGQKESVQGKAVSAQHEEKVKDLVAFLQLLLNTLGSNTTSARDKEVVITESYAKVFRDNKVQIEDDLAESRSTITNKDVVAYLKDVDFFFDNVTFEFLTDDIKQGVNANGQVFYKVSLRRILKGTTSAGGKTISNTIPRFIEVNYDADAEDLKIVSIYTNEFDEKESLINWWKSLSFEWQNRFKQKLDIADSVQLNDIKDMIALNELDLSGNRFLQSLEPLSQMVNLRLLNLSGTDISDLTPIRNLTELVELNLSGTQIFDLTPLRYATKLERLNINQTEVRSIAALEKMQALQNLEMQSTHVIDFAPLSFLTGIINLDLKDTQIASLEPLRPLGQIMELNVAKTPIQDITPLQNLQSITSLNIDSTLVRDIAPLSGLRNLEVLYANYTYLTTLNPLKDLPGLERVYCDHTPINKSSADAFMAANPEVLVIFDSKDLQAWWNALGANWKRILSNTAKITQTPGKEELARLPNLDSINFSNDRSITTLEPLRKLQKLKIILANNTAITDLTPLQDHREVRLIDISDTEVQDITPLAKFQKLETLRADRSQVEKLDPLFHIRTLKQVYVDRTTLHDITAQEFLDRNPDVLLVYKTIHLTRWWTNLPDGWKDVFQNEIGTDTTREALHRLVEKEAIHFRDARVRDLSPFTEFVRLKELHFSGTGITEIPDMENLRSLRSLRASSSPIQKTGAISQLGLLEDLDISNTPIDDLRGLGNLQNLRTLNCAGTQIKKLDALRSLVDLESLDCSNTRVSKLDAVMYLSLKSLKAYNTKVSSREVDKFRENNPECHVVYYR